MWWIIGGIVWVSTAAIAGVIIGRAIRLRDFYEEKDDTGSDVAR